MNERDGKSKFVLRPTVKVFVAELKKKCMYIGFSCDTRSQIDGHDLCIQCLVFLFTKNA